MSPQERKIIENDLMACPTIGDIFFYLSNYFDLFSKPIPALYRSIIISGIMAAVQWINPNKKKNERNI
jgi:hypothetical protein